MPLRGAEPDLAEIEAALLAADRAVQAAAILTVSSPALGTVVPAALVTAKASIGTALAAVRERADDGLTGGAVSSSRSISHVIPIAEAAQRMRKSKRAMSSWALRHGCRVKVGSRLYVEESHVVDVGPTVRPVRALSAQPTARLGTLATRPAARTGPNLGS